jgi:hypothetical protein
MMSGFRPRTRDLILTSESKRPCRSSLLVTCPILVAGVAVCLKVGSLSAGDSLSDPVARVKPESDLPKSRFSVATETPSGLFRVDETPSNPPQAIPSETADRLLRAAATEYILSGSSPSLDREMTLYAKQVIDYYDQGAKSADEIRADLSELRKRWPSRRYEISKIVGTQYDPNKDVGAVIVDYTFEVSNGTKRKAGEVETFLIFDAVSKRPRVILVNEHKVQ